MTPVTHRFRRCIGWSCLSEAQKTGIIVSIAVVSIILFLLYMHCLGKAAISRRERASVRLPGGRQVPRPRDQPQGVVVAQLPVVQQWPGGPAVVTYHPALFTVEGPHRATAQPLRVAESYPRPSLAAMHAVSPVQQQHGCQEASSRVATRAGDATQPAPQAAPDSPPPSIRRQGQPSWRQVVSRTLRLPVGRASTIDSSSAPGTPRHVHSPEGVHRGRLREETGREGVPVPSLVDKEQGNGGCQPPPLRTSGENDGDAGQTDTSSLQTNVAVVHSDDFETVDPHSRLAKPSVQEEVERRMEELSRIYWIPSESSLQPEGSQHSPDQAPVRET